MKGEGSRAVAASTAIKGDRGRGILLLKTSACLYPKQNSTFLLIPLPCLYPDMRSFTFRALMRSFFGLRLRDRVPKIRRRRQKSPICVVCGERVPDGSGATILPCYHRNFHDSCLDCRRTEGATVAGCPQCEAEEKRITVVLP